MGGFENVTIFLIVAKTLGALQFSAWKTSCWTFTWPGSRANGKLLTSWDFVGLLATDMSWVQLNSRKYHRTSALLKHYLGQACYFNEEKLLLSLCLIEKKSSLSGSKLYCIPTLGCVKIKNISLQHTDLITEQVKFARYLILNMFRFESPP